MSEGALWRPAQGYPIRLCLGTEPVGAKIVTDRAKRTALDKALRGLFGKLQARPLPDRMMSVVAQLDAADQAPLKKSGSR